MQIQTVLVRAALPVQEELAKLAGSETGANHPVVQHELVHREDRDR